MKIEDKMVQDKFLEFWQVINEESEQVLPKRRFLTEDLANEQASRYAEISPGKHFYVMKCTHLFVSKALAHKIPLISIEDV